MSCDCAPGRCLIDPSRPTCGARYITDDNGVLYRRALGDGRELCVIPRIYNSILTIGPSGSDGYHTHYCYETPIQAKAAMEEWDPATMAEPTGWFRHAASGRRRPGGDPSKEYIAL